MKIGMQISLRVRNLGVSNPTLIFSLKWNRFFSGKEIIPAGAHINISIAGVHLNEKTYPNPYTWDPNRFSEECSANRHPGSFIPFGFGSRICIGKWNWVEIKS